MIKIPYLFTVIGLLHVLISCQDDKKDSGGPAQELEGSIPSASEIRSLIETKAYKNWQSQDNIEKSPIHSYARTFINPILKSSQDNGQATHPVGSIAIKELYEDDQATIKGYAWEQKIKDGSGGETWLWYEDLDASTEQEDFYGVGISTCTGCHGSGIDFVRTSL